MGAQAKVVGRGQADRVLSEADVAAVCDEALGSWNLDGKRVLVLIPDNTRTCPLPLLFRMVYERVAPRAATLNFLVALGTHSPMPMEEIYRLVGITEAQHRQLYPKAGFHNHLWKDPAALTQIGTLSREETGRITDGLFRLDVDITVNRMVTEHDVVLILGPVFPHEVVGFSGGNKYLFPGVAGQEIIDFFHWLGAVITNYKIIGAKATPVRAVVDHAAGLLRAERKALCMVVKGHDLAGLYAGDPEPAWSAAADLSAQVHIEYKDRRFHTVLSCAPAMYHDVWLGGKCMYKTEPIVEDGGTVIIYAPHIKEVSPVHGRVLMEIGYHTRDFFLKQWERYKGYPWGVLAHSTHVKGMGTYENGVEKPRVEVVLATGIPEAVCRQINLGYRDPASIDPAAYANREAEGILYVPKAGEILYRRRD